MRQKTFLIFIFIIVGLVLVGYSLFLVSKSPTFQFFGTLISRVETQDKVVALTFDDGPTEYTKEVLNTVNRKNIKVTFFIIGQELEKYLALGKEIITSGHQLGNHSYTHQRFYLKSQSFIVNEIEKTNEVIRRTGYKGEIMFRPPYGKKLFGLPWYLQQKNIKSITWDVDPGSSNKDFTEYVLENTKPGSIIILHPFCSTCTADREAIEKVIDGLHAKGYTFVTLEELLKK